MKGDPTNYKGSLEHKMFFTNQVFFFPFRMKLRVHYYLLAWKKDLKNNNSLQVNSFCSRTLKCACCVLLCCPARNIQHQLLILSLLSSTARICFPCSGDHLNYQLLRQNPQHEAVASLPDSSHPWQDLSSFLLCLSLSICSQDDGLGPFTRVKESKSTGLLLVHCSIAGTQEQHVAQRRH